MFFGVFNREQDLTARITWTPVEDTATITASELTLVHEDGTTVVIPGEADPAPNSWKAPIAGLPKAGNWRARWHTTPVGGATDDWLRAD